MGKSKAKKGKLKRYPTPTERYLVISDPWGSQPSNPNFFNNVTAWMELMFKSNYPGTRPSAIYYQSTVCQCLSPLCPATLSAWVPTLCIEQNNNILVEIPDYVEIDQYLGTHYWSAFLLPPYCHEAGNRASYMYEYDYRLFNIPALQGGWSVGYARYTEVHPQLPVRDPYPEPLPAPNSTLPFAKKLPPAKVLLPNQIYLPPSSSPVNDEEPGSLDEVLHDQGSSKKFVGSSRSPHTEIEHEPRPVTLLDTSGSETYHPPDGLVNTVARTEILAVNAVVDEKLPHSQSAIPAVVKKRDPYEEEEIAQQLLRPNSCSVKPEPEDGQIKVEPITKSESLFDSNEFRTQFRSRSTTKVEPDDEQYQPSAELLAAFSTLSSKQQGSALSNSDSHCDVKIKIEPGNDGTIEYYTPSNELLEAMASLPSGMVELPSQRESSTSRRGTKAKSGLREHAYLTDTTPNPGGTRIKRESLASDLDMFTNGRDSAKRIKLEDDRLN